MSSPAVDKIVTVFGLQALSPSAQERAVLRIHKLVSLKALIKAVELLGDVDRKAFEELLDAQGTESEAVRLRSMLGFFASRRIDYSRVYFEEIHKLKIALIRRERTAHLTDRGLSFIEEIIGTVVADAVSSRIIPPAYQDAFEAGQLLGESTAGQSDDTLSRAARRKTQIFKFVVSSALVVLLEFATYAISSVLYRTHVIPGVPAWIESITPGFVKTLCRYLLS